MPVFEGSEDVDGDGGAGVCWHPIGEGGVGEGEGVGDGGSFAVVSK